MERESKFEVGDRVVVTAGLFKDHVRSATGARWRASLD